MYFWIALVVVIYVAVKWLLRQPRVGGYGEKYVFITGCDSGFGNSLAWKLDSLGFHVIAGCLTEKGETDLKKACSKKLKSISLDVTSDMSISNAVAEIKKILPSRKVCKKNNKMYSFPCPDISKVVDAYTHAVTARWSKASLLITPMSYHQRLAALLQRFQESRLFSSPDGYVVGNEANSILRLLWNLPEWLRLWAVVNNAGIAGPLCPFEWLNKEDFDTILAINLWSVIYVSQACLPLRRRESGRSVNMSIISGRFPCGGCPYIISKAGVEAFSDTLRHELYTTGVTVYIIEPGLFGKPLLRFFKPEIVRRILQDRYGKLKPEVKQFYGQEIVEKICKSNSNLVSTPCIDISKVVDAYTHAITARWPKARYVVGNDANFIFRLLWNLPEWLSDYIFHRVHKS